MYIGRNKPNCRSGDDKPIPLSDCIAKTVIDTDGHHCKGIDVETHCKIVGLVAAELISRLPVKLHQELFPQGSELVAAVHDIGKVNPLFQEKIRRGITGYGFNSFPGLEKTSPELEETVGRHSGVSQAALKDTGRYIPEIAGRHHGSSPNSDFLLPEDAIIGGQAWQEERLQLIHRLKNYFHLDWPAIRDNLHATVLAGLTTVSDWIGSGPVFDNLMAINESELMPLVQSAVDLAGFVPPLIIHGLHFEDIFPSYSPRTIQNELISKVDQSGVYILEAPMGEGKTEAALFAAYRMLDSSQANGIYFALPTQITSEKIHERMHSFLDRILSSEDNHRLLLLHGNAWLYETELGEEGRPGYSWFDSRKRGLLSPFAVGTIDQALMAVMNVKHGFVRAFGLMGKVVILDEVHSYDAYTGTIMDHLIKGLVELGCTVILLSATLTTERKSLMTTISAPSIDANIPDYYPLVTKAIPGKPKEYSTPIPMEQSSIGIINSTDDDTALCVVREKALNGEYMLWIENTVNEAQEIFKKFAAWGVANSIEVGLLHSRFPALVRSKLDNHWVGLYGKQGKEQRCKGGRILIGTQVLEQSLDIDADFLVTRIAPTDMVLQRTGRLWRHRDLDSIRPVTARRQMIILAPNVDTAVRNPLRFFKASGFVYAPYVLARSLEIWAQKSSILIPADMRNLIESTYAERTETGEMSIAKYNLYKQRKTLGKFACNSMTMAGGAQTDNVPTRYSEKPTCEVLLLRRGSDLPNGFLILIDGEKLTLPVRTVQNRSEKKKIARMLMERTISVPNYLAPNVMLIQELRPLSPYLYISENEDVRLRVAVLESSGTISGMGERTANDQYTLEYSPVFGYATKKKEDA